MVEKAYPARKTDLPVALGAKPPQSSLLAAREFHTASEECCRRGNNPCVQTLLPDVVVPETHRNRLHLVKL